MCARCVSGVFSQNQEFDLQLIFIFPSSLSDSHTWMRTVIVLYDIRGSGMSRYSRSLTRVYLPSPWRLKEKTWQLLSV